MVTSRVAQSSGKAEDRVSGQSGGSENTYYKSAAIGHLQNYKQSKKDKWQ